MPRRPRRLFGSLRFYTALAAVALMNLAWLPFVGRSGRGICTPGMNCHGCPAATGACPVGAMAYSSVVRSPSMAVLASVGVVGLASDRLVCGYVCPFGWFQDLFYRIPGPKIPLPRWTRYGKYVMLLGFVVLLPWMLGLAASGFVSVDKPTVNSHPEGLELEVVVRNPSSEPVQGVELDALYQNAAGEVVETHRRSFPELSVPPGGELTLPAFTVPNLLEDNELLVTSPQSAIVPQPSQYLYFCKICPVGTLEASVPALFQQGGSAMYGGGDSIWATLQRGWLRFGILLAFLLLMWMASRAFCRLMCPLGAAYGIASPLAMSRMELDSSQCTSCQACSKVCPVDLDVPTEVGKAECIACGDCMKACPQQGIKRRFGW